MVASAEVAAHVADGNPSAHRMILRQFIRARHLRAPVGTAEVIDIINVMRSRVMAEAEEVLSPVEIAVGSDALRMPEGEFIEICHVIGMSERRRDQIPRTERNRDD